MKVAPRPFFVQKVHLWVYLKTKDLTFINRRGTIAKGGSSLWGVRRNRSRAVVPGRRNDPEAVARDKGANGQNCDVSAILSNAVPLHQSSFFDKGD